MIDKRHVMIWVLGLLSGGSVVVAAWFWYWQVSSIRPPGVGLDPHWYAPVILFASASVMLYLVGRMQARVFQAQDDAISRDPLSDETGRPATPRYGCATVPGDGLQASLMPDGGVEVRMWDAHAVHDVWAASSLTPEDAHDLKEWIQDNVSLDGMR